MSQQKIDISGIKPELYLDLINVMVLILDLDGRIAYVNRRGANILGYENPPEVVGLNWFEKFVPQERVGKVKSVFSRMISGDLDPVEYYENPILRKDGFERDIFWRNSHIRDENGEIIGIMTTGEDVTDKKRVEAEIQRSQKLDSLSLLAGGLAHDFNNLLTIIEGNISLSAILSQEKKIKEYLLEAEKSCEKAKRLTSELLTFATGSSIRKSVRMREVAQGAALISLSGGKHKADFELPDEFLIVNVDPIQIEQTICNIVKNSQEAMPEGGTIKFILEKVNLEKGNRFLLPPGDFAKLSIRDSGVGIAPENMRRIFDPYFSTKVKGLGFGLATAFSIIMKHGGYIDVKSELGKGTEVAIYLPLAATEKIVHVAQDKKEEVPNRLDARIIVMDDEPMIQQVVGHILEYCGCEVRCAYDGREALSIYRECKESRKPVDLVIMDLTVPVGMGGLDAMRELLSYDPEAKAIISSGYLHDFAMSDYKKYGFRGVITKPYTANDLKEVVYRAIHS